MKNVQILIIVFYFIIPWGMGGHNGLAADGDDNIGGWSGNGGGDAVEVDNIWYLGTRPIEYCLKIAPDFPFNSSQIKEAIRDSIDRWQLFFSKYGLDENALFVPTFRSRIPMAVGVGLGDDKRATLSFKESENCELDQGINGDSEDVRSKKIAASVGERLFFYMDISNPVIDRFRSISEEFEVGGAIRTKYNHQTYRSGGFIWIGSFTKDFMRFRHLLLHEIGHVLGIKHNSVFVMSENTVQDLQNTNNFSSDYFGEIESPVWPYRLRENEEMLLSSNKGLLRRLPLNERSCPSNDFRPNKAIPNFVWDYLGSIFDLHLGTNPLFLHRGCHKIIFSYAKETSAEHPLLKRFTLTMILHPSNKKLTFEGNFVSEPKDVLAEMVPGVYTKWEHPLYRGQWLWRKGIIDSVIPPFPAQGSLKIRTGASTTNSNSNSEQLAVTIKNNKGISLEIFIPKGNRWWNLRGSIAD